MSGWPIRLDAIVVCPGEMVWLWHQVLLSIQQFPQVVAFLLQKHPEELVVHRAGHAPLLLVLLMEMDQNHDD